MDAGENDLNFVWNSHTYLPEVVTVQKATVCPSGGLFSAFVYKQDLTEAY